MSSLPRNRVPVRRLIVVGALLGATSSAHADDWTSLGLDGARHRVSAERSGAAFGSKAWRYSLPPAQDSSDRALVSSPAVADGYVVLGTTTGYVLALRAVDGKLLWRFKAGDGMHSSPAIVNGKVIIPSFDRNIYALSLHSGQVLWKRDVGGVQLSSPAVVGDGAGDADGASIAIATGFPRRSVMRIAANTGRVRWETGHASMNQSSNSSVAVARDQVIVGAMAGTYYSFDLETGAQRWTTRAGGMVHMSTPVVLGDRAYMLPGGSSHSVHAVDLASGEASEGWPFVIPNLEADSIGGAIQKRDYAVSSAAAVGGLLVFELRTLEHIDTTGRGSADTYLLREETVAVEPSARAVAWRMGNGRLVTRDMSAIPAFGVCPTPLAYPTPSGQWLVVTASSLSAKLRVLSAASGAELWSTSLSGPTRGSPAFANGRLFVATDAGVVHGFLSAANAPPEAPFLSAGARRSLPNVGARLSWLPAIDPDRDPASYEVRLDRDGEVLSTWEHALTLPAGHTFATLPWALVPEAIYTYAVRARDDKGAWSEWSASGTFTTVSTPAVSINGRTAASLSAALATARPGDTVTLGAGTFRLNETLRVAEGVTVSGAGPQRTVIDARGLEIGVALQGSRSSGGAGAINHVTVSGARVGVSVGRDRSGHLDHVIIRDNGVVGVDVDSGGRAQVINGTLIRNGVALRAAGAIDVRNSLVIDNHTGIAATGAGHVISRYNNINGNVIARDQTTAGDDDLDLPVTFVNAAQDDFHLTPAQPVTDRGDPDDDFAKEPSPNGGRVNLGAFGSTNEAETSAPTATTPPRDVPPIAATAADSSGPRSAPEPVGADQVETAGPTVGATPGSVGSRGCRTAARSDGSGGRSAGTCALAALAFAALVLRSARRR